MPGLVALAHKIAHVPSLAGADLDFLHQFKPQRRLFKRGTTLISAATVQTNAFLICSGWAASYRALPNGERQLVNILLPGDFAGIEAALTPIADRSVEAQTAVTAFVLDAACLTTFLKLSPRLGEAALWSMIQETSMVIEHLCCVGRRNALERICHFMLELWIRLRQIELCPGDTFFNPLTLGEISDALGMSEVHLSRMVQRLREAGLFQIDFAHRKVTVLNAARAAQICSFDPSYLKYHSRIGHEFIQSQSNTSTPMSL